MAAPVLRSKRRAAPPCTLLLRAAVQLLALCSRAVLAAGSIAHDAVVGFDEAVPDQGSEGDLMLAYKPYLKVYNGCVPFPAVDADGNTSGGLNPSGGSSSDCDSSTGQIYARAAGYNGYYAVMYSWYFPKDSPSTGLGHRHDWENSVVFLSSDNSDTAQFAGMAVSAHGEYSSESPSSLGTNPFVGYISYWPLNHQLIFTNDQGGTQPLIAWGQLTDAARTALQNTDFGDANVAFKDSVFEGYLADAYNAVF